MLRIKKDDEVVVISGKDRGKTGRVLKVDPAKQKVIVESINMIKKTARRTPQNQQGGFIETEAPIHISNVMLLDKKTNKPTRFGIKVEKDGKKVRISKKSGEVI